MRYCIWWATLILLKISKRIDSHVRKYNEILMKMILHYASNFQKEWYAQNKHTHKSLQIHLLWLPDVFLLCDFKFIHGIDHIFPYKQCFILKTKNWI